MMPTRALALALTALPFLAAANPVALDARADCGTGDLQCCDTTETAGSAAGAALLSALGIVVQDVNVLLGVTCSPISVIGVGGSSSCSANAVCCSDNSHGGLVSIGCVPVNV